MDDTVLTSARSLTVPILDATGTGPTVLAAFDDALMKTGVANYNLVRLSSVIPPGAQVLPVRQESGADASMGSASGSLRQSALGGTWGDRLYAVWAFEGAQLLGQEAWAGVAWVQDPNDGRGLFVEHEGGSEAQVREELNATMASICASRGLSHLEQHSSVVGCRCEGSPVGALVIAPYSIGGW